MRLRGWLALSFLAACGSFGSSDGDDDGSGNADAGSGGDSTATEAAANDDSGTDAPGPDSGFVVGPAADAACSASKRCIDFETAPQQTTPFGFDSKSDTVDGGGLAIVTPGFMSAHALSSRAFLNDDRARGELTFATAPTAVRMRLKVREEVHDAGDITSAHFLRFVCPNAENLSVKFSKDGNISAQIASNGMPAGPYTVGTWAAVDVTLLSMPSSRTLTVTLPESGASKTMTSNDTCTSLTVRVGTNIEGPVGFGDVTISVDDVAIDWN